MCAKVRTVAASNNRDHPTRSLYYCLFPPHTYIFVLRAHPVRGESYNQRNTTGEVAAKQKFSQSDPVLIRQFSNYLQSDPVLIRPELASVLIPCDPVLIHAHLCLFYHN